MYWKREGLQKVLSVKPQRVILLEVVFLSGLNSAVWPSHTQPLTAAGFPPTCRTASPPLLPQDRGAPLSRTSCRGLSQQLGRINTCLFVGIQCGGNSLPLEAREVATLLAFCKLCSEMFSGSCSGKVPGTAVYTMVSSMYCCKHDPSMQPRSQDFGVGGTGGA